MLWNTENIIGIVVGSIGILTLFILLFVCWYRQCRRLNSRSGTGKHQRMPPNSIDSLNSPATKQTVRATQLRGNQSQKANSQECAGLQQQPEQFIIPATCVNLGAAAPVEQSSAKRWFTQLLSQQEKSLDSQTSLKHPQRPSHFSAFKRALSPISGNSHPGTANPFAYSNLIPNSTTGQASLNQQQQQPPTQWSGSGRDTTPSFCNTFAGSYELHDRSYLDSDLFLSSLEATVPTKPPTQKSLPKSPSGTIEKGPSVSFNLPLSPTTTSPTSLRSTTSSQQQQRPSFEYTTNPGFRFPAPGPPVAGWSVQRSLSPGSRSQRKIKHHFSTSARPYTRRTKWTYDTLKSSTDSASGVVDGPQRRLRIHSDQLSSSSHPVGARTEESILQHDVNFTLPDDQQTSLPNGNRPQPNRGSVNSSSGEGVEDESVLEHDDHPRLIKLSKRSLSASRFPLLPDSFNQQYHSLGRFPSLGITADNNQPALKSGESSSSYTTALIL